VMKRSGRARRSHFMLIIITTYGETLKGIWGEEHKKSKAQLAGTKFNHRRFVMIASAEPITVVSTVAAAAGSIRVDVWRLEQPIPAGELLKFESSGGGIVACKLSAPAKRFQRFIECEPLPAMLPPFSEASANKDWRSDHAIIRANPSVGIVYPIEEIREDREDSVGPEAEAEFKQLSLNIVSGGGHRWLSGAVWQHNARHRVLMSSLVGQRCFGGNDFSFRTDLTAFWLAFPSWSHNIKFSKVSEPLIRLIGLVWVPEEGIEEREEKEEIPYRAYAEIPYIGDMGCVRICPGPVIDYQMMAQDTLDLCSRFKVQAVAYDPAYSQFVITPYLIPGGLKCIPHRPGAISMGPPTIRFEQLLKRGLIAHGGHPLLDEAVNGAVLHKPDKAGNRYPSKEKSTSRIDPLVSAVMATGWACDPPQELKGSGAWSGKGTGAFG
jgi:phage terminase large subunit-like protein